MIDPTKTPFGFLAPLLVQTGQIPHPNFLAAAYGQSLLNGMHAGSGPTSKEQNSTPGQQAGKASGFLISDILKAKRDEEHHRNIDVDRPISSGTEIYAAYGFEWFSQTIMLLSL